MQEFKSMTLTQGIIKEKQEWRVSNFRTDQPEKFDLSIEFGNTHFSYAVFDSVTRFIKTVGKIEFDFQEKKDSYAILFSELQSTSVDIIQNGYNRVYATWNAPGATLIPASFYNENKKVDFLQFNNGATNNQRIIAEDTRGGEIKVLYSIPEPIKMYLDAKFSNHKIKHVSSSLMDIIASSSTRNTDKLGFINLNTSNFNLLLMDKGLRFFNTFNYTTQEDILYYILFALEQNGFDAHEDKILLSGEVESESGTHKLLKDYIKNISFAITDKSLLRNDNISKLPHHFFFNLLNRFVCG